MVFIQAHFLYKYAEFFVCTSLQFYQQYSIKHFITISTAVQFGQLSSEFNTVQRVVYQSERIMQFRYREDLYQNKLLLRWNGKYSSKHCIKNHSKLHIIKDS